MGGFLFTLFSFLIYLAGDIFLELFCTSCQSPSKAFGLYKTLFEYTYIFEV